MISRRHLLRTLPSLTAPAWLLQAQDADESIFRADFNMVVLSFTVTDRWARYINGLEANEIRVLEDGIPQAIAVFSESGKPPLRVQVDRTTSRLAEGNAPDEAGGRRLGLKEFETIRDRQENSYTIAYRPDPANRSRSFRKVGIEVVSDTVGNLRVKHRAGYHRTV